MSETSCICTVCGGSLFWQSTHEELEAEAGKNGYSCIMLKPLRATSMATALLQAS